MNKPKNYFITGCVVLSAIILSYLPPMSGYNQTNKNANSKPFTTGKLAEQTNTLVNEAVEKRKNDVRSSYEKFKKEKDQSAATIAQLKAQLADAEKATKAMQKDIDALKDYALANRKLILGNKKNIEKLSVLAKTDINDSTTDSNIVVVNKCDSVPVKAINDTTIQYRSWFWGKKKYKPLHKK